jgi:nitrogenase molybdenum-iron protein beta chain
VSNLIEQPRFSCALGAQQTVVAISRATPILHAGPGCGSKVSGIIGQGEGYAGGNTIPCTNAGESEVVFGGERKLRGVIDGSLKVIDADLYVVLTGCTSDIVGDDVESIVADYQKEDVPIVQVATGGFKSNNFVSHENVVNAIIDQYVDKFSTDRHVIKGLVNVFATVPYQDPYWEGNFEEIKRILEGLGLSVNILFGSASGGVSEWLTIPNAEFNIVVNTWVGLGIVKHLEKKYGTKFVHFPYLPVGGIETSKFLRTVGEFAGIDPARLDAYIQKEEKRFYIHIERMADFVLEFKYGLPRNFYIILDAPYAIGFSKYLLNELGILPARIFVADDTPEEYQENIREQFHHISAYKSAEVIFEVDGGIILETIKQNAKPGRNVILGSSWESEYAKEISADLLIVNVPVIYKLILNCGYAGYNGGLRIAEDLYNGVLASYR